MTMLFSEDPQNLFLYYNESCKTAALESRMKSKHLWTSKPTATKKKQKLKLRVAVHFVYSLFNVYGRLAFRSRLFQSLVRCSMIAWMSRTFFDVILHHAVLQTLIHASMLTETTFILSLSHFLLQIMYLPCVIKHLHCKYTSVMWLCDAIFQL